MKFTLSLLKDHLKTEASLDEILNALTNGGLKVEEVAERSGNRRGGAGGGRGTGTAPYRDQQLAIASHGRAVMRYGPLALNSGAS